VRREAPAGRVTLVHQPSLQTVPQGVTPVVMLDIASWRPRVAAVDVEHHARALEAGSVLVLPRLAFGIEADETRFLDVRWSDGKAKNISLEGQAIKGARGAADDLAALARMVGRFAADATALVGALFPRYAAHLLRARTSYRPFGAAGRAVSWRKDDTRLHVDSFPATPTGGRRILRVFTNVNPDGKPRAWRVGGDFESVARRFANTLSIPLPGSGHLLALLRVTKSPRSAYDALMLQLHDRMKGDEDFQRGSPQAAIDFPAGSTWLAFTDEVSHAAMAGQYQLEQTFLVPVASMQSPERSPLRVLERLKGKRLA
jgi:hypothetical protein